MRVRVLPYKQGSKGAKALAEALGGRVLKLQNSRFRPRVGDVVINWGSSADTPLLSGFPKINAPEKIQTASNKLSFFLAMNASESEIIPPFWQNKEQIPEDAYPIVCRTVLNGHSGEGIVIANNPEELVSAPLYVKYIKKRDEYRVHVGSTNQVILVQRKARRRDTPDEEVNWQIRNHDNGFVFVRKDVTPPECVLNVAVRALVATGLDFGAVDVVYHDREDRAYVLEVNTAPGLEGSTAEDYARFFRREALHEEQG
jgi:Glutathione synthase/Ribosomal protein S6 modification enzyme (glutaminyl transferase)